MTKVLIVEDATEQEAWAIADDMRANDRYEAECFGLTPEAAVLASVRAAADSHVAYLGDEPVFAFGTVHVMPHVRQLWGFGTPKTKKAIPEITRYTNDVWLPRLWYAGVRRIQVHLPATNLASIGWLESFGMIAEATMRDFSTNGAIILQMAFTEKEFREHVFLEQPAAGRLSAACGAA